MTNFNYDTIIEYVDCTFDENFENAKHWCMENNALLIELIDRRREKDGVLYRYFQIKEIPPPVPTEEELKDEVRMVRNTYLQDTDFTQLPDAPFTSEEKLQYAQYRQYLRDYTEGENWWLKNPLDFDSWKE